MNDHVNDTTPAIEARYRAMLLQRSGEERLRMGAAMYATARSILARIAAAAER